MKLLFIAILSIATCVCAYAQEQPQVYYSKKYLDINIKRQTKFNEQFTKKQSKLLEKLKKKEQKLSAKLKRKDSATHALYSKNLLTFDSISKLKKPDSLTLVRKSKLRVNSTIDSLKGVKNFLEDKAHVTGAGKNDLGKYGTQLNGLKADQYQQNEVADLIRQRTQYLKGLSSRSGQKLKGLKSIRKQNYYSGQKIKAYKDIANKPSVAEEKALEYLQGQQGFEEKLSYSDVTGTQGMGSDMSLDQLEKMGFQTKRKVSENLKSRYGDNLKNLQQNLGGQIKEYQDKLNEVKKVKQSAKQTKSSLKNVKNIQKPDFKINPMRGLPFAQRLEKQFNWQTTRATLDGKPAILNLSAMVGFKHTPRLSYGVGLASSFGLGKSWSQIKFTFEGIGLRTYAAWQWVYGIGAYAGYERMYKQAVFESSSINEQSILRTNEHNTNRYNESVLIGVTKAYRINDKLNGSIQVLYDIWWQHKGLRSPIQIRFATLIN